MAMIMSIDKLSGETTWESRSIVTSWVILFDQRTLIVKKQYNPFVFVLINEILCQDYLLTLELVRTSDATLKTKSNDDFRIDIGPHFRGS